MGMPSSLCPVILIASDTDPGLRNSTYPTLQLALLSSKVPLRSSRDTILDDLGFTNWSSRLKKFNEFLRPKSGSQLLDKDRPLVSLLLSQLGRWFPSISAGKGDRYLAIGDGSLGFGGGACLSSTYRDDLSS
jgi:hypothetical protein